MTLAGEQTGAQAVAGVGVGSVLAGRYVLETVVATGGMGALFRGRDTVLERTVAVKTLHPHLVGGAFAERFLREGHTLASLVHPNLVMIYDMGMASGLPYLVMEFIEGESLAAYIERAAPVPPAQGVALGLQVCRGLGYAHTWGVVHRDIKPQNVLIMPDSQVRIIDFGIARGPGASDMTEPGWVLGTAHYMAPEVAAGQPATAQSDLYALGVVLYRLLTGRLPFDGSDPLNVAMQHRTAPVPRPSNINPGVPPLLEAVLLRLLEKDPTRRYASAGDVAAALELSLKGAPVAPAAIEDATRVLAVAPVAQPAMLPQDAPVTTVRPAARPVLPTPRRRGARWWHWLLLFMTASVAASVMWGWLRMASAAPTGNPPPAASRPSPSPAPRAAVSSDPTPVPTQRSAPPPERPADMLTAFMRDIDVMTDGARRGGELDQLQKRAEDMAKRFAQGKTAEFSAKANEVSDKIGDLVRRGELPQGAAAQLESQLRALVDGLGIEGGRRGNDDRDD